MLDRNRRIKAHPERFQETEEEFDLVVTVEERVYDQVIEYLESRGSQSYSPVHVINLDIQDNHEEATVGAFHICEMCQAVSTNSNTVEHAIHVYCWLGYQALSLCIKCIYRYR